MLDHITEEMISAYIDGELTVDEQQLVEQQLAESSQHRDLYLELQQLRSAFQSLPRRRLATDFRDRVLAEIEQAEQTPGKQWAGATAATGVPGAETALDGFADRPTGPDGSTKPSWWQVGLALSAIAATVTAIVWLNRGLDSDPAGPGVGPNLASETQLPSDSLFTPDETWYDEQFVYYLPTRRAHTFTMIVNVVITPEGQANAVFRKAFRHAGVPFDPEMAIDPSLEESLLSSQLVDNVLPATGDDEQDVVDLYYVVCESDKADAIQSYLGSRRHEVSIQLNVAANSREMEMLYQLNRSSVEQFAGLKSTKEKRSLVHRLALSIRLRSAALPAFVVTGMGAGQAEANAARLPAAATPHLSRLQAAPTELLFVVRNLRE